MGAVAPHRVVITAVQHYTELFPGGSHLHEPLIRIVGGRGGEGLGNLGAHALVPPGGFLHGGSSTLVLPRPARLAPATAMLEDKGAAVAGQLLRGVATSRSCLSARMNVYSQHNHWFYHTMQFGYPLSSGAGSWARG